jgi:ABC-type nitrate/sulfonate/bicarbonate transport system permease component
LGKKFTIVRNALGFIAALIIGAIMGAILWLNRLKDIN